MIFLLLDFLLSFLSDIPTFFVLFSILLYPKNKFFFFLLIPLVLDLFIVDTYFLNTIIFTLLFWGIKFLKITKNNFFHFLLLTTLVNGFYIFILGSIKGFSALYLVKFMGMNYFVNLIFYALCYKILRPYIKLSR